MIYIGFERGYGSSLDHVISIDSQSTQLQRWPPTWCSLVRSSLNNVNPLYTIMPRIHCAFSFSISTSCKKYGKKHRQEPY
ncbi:hypothetical protein XELAEV_18032936mg [Xenopus laevis]|uniref:Uncharacterized protein n=1 Tax=Xenopus laevis TaxID=8355 RepID=A0A974CIG0_XENLA|nr:hypothetical protein XELAEV_18032936mg [Xenopus laevis]